jgi:maltose O-acetyltransferase
MMATEKQKMLSGELYDPADPELVADRDRVRALCHAFNFSLPDQCAVRTDLLEQILRRASDVRIEPPFFCDYGFNISLGDSVYFNFNCIVLDVMPVHIGDRCLFGPAVQIYTAMHPMDPGARRRMLESAKPVTIGADVWVGGGAIICPGVAIGDGTVIGAGSVVTRDIPGYVFAAGNPCRVHRALSSTT